MYTKKISHDHKATHVSGDELLFDMFNVGEEMVAEIRWGGKSCN